VTKKLTSTGGGAVVDNQYHDPRRLASSDTADYRNGPQTPAPLRLMVGFALMLVLDATPG
jgi:hypothetical protein